MIFRSLDILFSFCGLVILSPFFLIIYLLGIFDTGSPLFIQKRVGIEKKPFNLIKFRTMSIETESVASHLASSANITKLELAKKIKKQIRGLEIKIIKNSFDPDKRDYFVSNDKIEKKGYRTTVSLEDGIDELIKVFENSNLFIKNNY